MYPFHAMPMFQEHAHVPVWHIATAVAHDRFSSLALLTTKSCDLAIVADTHLLVRVSKLKTPLAVCTRSTVHQARALRRVLLLRDQCQVGREKVKCFVRVANIVNDKGQHQGDLFLVQSVLVPVGTRQRTLQRGASCPQFLHSPVRYRGIRLKCQRTRLSPCQDPDPHVTPRVIVMVTSIILSVQCGDDGVLLAYAHQSFVVFVRVSMVPRHPAIRRCLGRFFVGIARTTLGEGDVQRGLQKRAGLTTFFLLEAHEAHLRVGFHQFLWGSGLLKYADGLLCVGRGLLKAAHRSSSC